MHKLEKLMLGDRDINLLELFNPISSSIGRNRTCNWWKMGPKFQRVRRILPSITTIPLFRCLLFTAAVLFTYHCLEYREHQFTHYFLLNILRACYCIFVIRWSNFRSLRCFINFFLKLCEFFIFTHK